MGAIMNDKERGILCFQNTKELKGIAIMFVILGHIGIIKFTGSGAWGVSIFLILSGFGLAQSFLKSGLDKYFSKKITKVRIPFSTVTVIWIVVDKLILNKSYSFKDIILNVTGLNIMSPIDGSMWYITYLIIWYCVFYVVFKIPIKNIAKIFSMFLIGIVCYVAIQIIFTNDNVIGSYSFCFPTGVTIGLYYKKMQKFSISQQKKYTVMLFISSFIIFYSFICFIGIKASKIGVVPTVSIAIMLMSLIGLLSLFKLKSKVLAFIGDISYEMYLFEFVFIHKYPFIFNLHINIFLKNITYLLFIVVLSIGYKRILSKIGKTKNIIGRVTVKQS